MKHYKVVYGGAHDPRGKEVPVGFKFDVPDGAKIPGALVGKIVEIDAEDSASVLEFSDDAKAAADAEAAKAAADAEAAKAADAEAAKAAADAEAAKAAADAEAKKNGK